MYKEILTLLGLDYKDDPIIKLYFVVLGIGLQKIRSIK